MEFESGHANGSKNYNNGAIKNNNAKIVAKSFVATSTLNFDAMQSNSCKERNECNYGDGSRKTGTSFRKKRGG